MAFYGPNPYLFVIVNEVSRYPFEYYYRDISFKNVVEYFCILFLLFGFPEYIRIDREMSFVAKEIKMLLTSTEIATRRSTPYYLQGNAQC